MIDIDFTNSKDQKFAHYIVDDFKNFMGDPCFNFSTLKIINQTNDEFPMTKPQRRNNGQKEDYIIGLNFNSLRQMIYQLSHELGHFFMACYPEDKYQWMSEILCAIFSIIYLDKDNDSFYKSIPAIGNECKEYLLFMKNKINNYDNRPLNIYVQENLNDLESDPYKTIENFRYRNNHIAYNTYTQLQDIIEGITAVKYFAIIKNPDSYNSFFDDWKNLCKNEYELNFVIRLQQLFGF